MIDNSTPFSSFWLPPHLTVEEQILTLLWLYPHRPMPIVHIVQQLQILNQIPEEETHKALNDLITVGKISQIPTEQVILKQNF